MNCDTCKEICLTKSRAHTPVMDVRDEDITECHRMKGNDDTQLGAHHGDTKRSRYRIEMMGKQAALI